MFACLGPFAAEATVTFQNASGITRRETIEERETLFAGAAGTCTGTSPCNTCAGATGLSICNETSVGPNVIFRIEAVVTASTITSPVVSLRSVTKNAPVNLTLEGPDSNGLISATGTWSSLCTQFSDATCSASFSDTWQFGIGDDSSEPDDKVEIKIVFGAAPAGSQLTTACRNQSVTGQGICYFTIEPGDEKVYLKELVSSTDFPGTGGSSSEVKFTDVIFYFEPVLNGESDATALARISTSSSSAVIGVTGSVESPLADDRIQGLDNDQRYCFTFANRDNTGNIYRFANVTNTTDYPDTSEICASPLLVVGLLDDKKCFIATAAWGSPFDPHVKDLRAFRDRYLLTNSLGRAFVDWYYTHSPDWADWISTHDEIRGVVRAALWPLWIIVKLVLIGGLLAALVTASGLTAGVIWWMKRRRARRLA